MSSCETVDPSLQAQRRLFHFVVTNMILQGLPQVIGWMPLGPLRIGVTAAVIGVAVLIAPLVLQKVRESSDGSTEVAARLRLLALIYAGLLALIAFVELPFGLAHVVGSAAVTAFIWVCFSCPSWGMPESLMFWRYPPAEQA